MSSKLFISSKEKIDHLMEVAKTSTNPKELDKLGCHEYFGIRLYVAINEYTSIETLEKLASNTLEYKSVQQIAKNRIINRNFF